MHAYRELLAQHDISIENLVSWFFTTYLKQEFGVENFHVDFLDSQETAARKINRFTSQIDSIFKQYKCYVEHGKIDTELLKISSKTPNINAVPSLINNKYCYADESSENLRKEQFLLFSDQSPLAYNPQLHKKLKPFWHYLDTDIYLKNIGDRGKKEIEWLIERGTVSLDSNQKIMFNVLKIYPLLDLYSNEVLCFSYIVNMKNPEIQKLIDSKEIIIESSLFSRPEQDYYNFLMNKSSFPNGGDLRNKHAHGNRVDEKEAEQDYIDFLKILILIVLKINEEFCLTYPEEKTTNLQEK